MVFGYIYHLPLKGIIFLLTTISKFNSEVPRDYLILRDMCHSAKNIRNSVLYDIQEKLRDCRKEMNAILDAIEVKHAMLMKSNLSLVHSKPADWYELTLRKIGKAQHTASKRENKADLRLVG